MATDLKTQLTDNIKKVFKSLIIKYDEINWAQISQAMSQKYPKLKWSSKSCKQLWKHVRSKKKKQLGKKKWDKQQEKLLFESHRMHGQKHNKWKEIAQQFPHRSVREVKNHFYSLLRKRLRGLNKLISGDKNSTQKIKKIKPSSIQKLLRDEFTIQHSYLQLSSLNKLISLLVQYDNPEKITLNSHDKQNFISIFMVLQQKSQSSQDQIYTQSLSSNRNEPIAKRIRRNQAKNITDQNEDLLQYSYNCNNMQQVVCGDFEVHGQIFNLKDELIYPQKQIQLIQQQLDDIQILKMPFVEDYFSEPRHFCPEINLMAPEFRFLYQQNQDNI